MRIDGSFSIENSLLSATGPVQPEITLISPDEYTVKFMVEGIYYITASAIGLDGLTYQDTIVIMVINKMQLDSLLKEKWDGMKVALMQRDIETSGSYFVPASQDQYMQIFTELSTDQIYAIFSNIIDFKVDSLIDGSAECGALRVESDGTYSYPVTFVQDENGIWKIMGF